MFSPSSLVQSMIQRSSVSSPKTVELTPGQVFRGTVIKQYPENMALVQIGGMQVQAKLEANLETGQKAWLQVQPNSDVVTLKVLDAPVAANGKDASLESLIRSLGLPETKESRAIVQALVNANLPVTREAVQAFASVVQRLGMDEGTIKAFLMAMKRNLPLTPDTVSGLKAFLSEKPLSQVVQNFLQQASQFLDENQAVRQGQMQASTNVDMRQLVGQIRDKLAGLPVLLMSAEDAEGKAPASPGQAGVSRGAADQTQVQSQVQVSAAQPRSNGQSAAPASTPVQTPQASPGSAVNANVLANTGQASASPAGNPATPPQTVVANGRPDQPLQPATAQAGQAVGNTAAQAKDSQPGPIGTNSISSMAGTATARTGATEPSQLPAQAAGLSREASGIPSEQAMQTAAARSAADATAATSQQRNPIMELFRQLGLSHERELMAQTLSQGSWDAQSLKQMESVKSMLLQLTQANSATIPAALREAADQLLQQVTGQQLMMVSSSNQVLTQVVLQIPLRTENGDETAYVQIESQKKGGGPLDAENCRLFFHLDLQELGTTMIDVNIVNKIVNLHIYNDTPGLEMLAQAMRDGFAEQLAEVGYQLSAMRFTAIPEQQSKIPQAASSAVSSMMADYKGVDLRV